MSTFQFSDIEENGVLSDILDVEETGTLDDILCCDDSSLSQSAAATTPTSPSTLSDGGAIPPLSVVSNWDLRELTEFCQRTGRVSLAQGNVELPPPRQLRSVLQTQIRDIADEPHAGMHTYINRLGVLRFRTEVQKWLETKGVSVPLEAIMATSGVTGGTISALMLCRAMKIRNVGLFEPYFSYHDAHVRSTLKVQPTIVSTNADFSPNWDALDRAIAGGMRAVILTNPGNPHGKVWSRADIERLVRVTKAARCYLILDEIYCDMVLNDRVHFYSPVMDAPLEKHVVVCRGFSKCLGVQSWRIGFAIAHPQFITQLVKPHATMYGCTNWMQYPIAEYLGSHPEDFDRHTADVRDLINRNWSVLSHAFSESLGWEPIHPDASMFALVRHDRDSDAEAVREVLKRGVGVLTGSMFYSEKPTCTGYIRVSLGSGHHNALAAAERLLEKKED